MARLVLPASFAGGLESYRLAHVARLRAYGRAALPELEADFAREKNPVFVWEALAACQRCGLETPQWVLDELIDIADRILAILGSVTEGKSIEREADRVGRALGFGTRGPGKGGWFSDATILQRDRMYYRAVMDLFEGGHKIVYACEDVARAEGVDRSTVHRGYTRIAKIKGDPVGRRR